jgi:hypothetical protein
VAVNLIVLGVTLLMAAFVGVWLFFPRLRDWIEMPKHRFLEAQRQFPSVLRDGQPGTEEPAPHHEERRPGDHSDDW